MWRRLQPFGYATPEQSLYHDTDTILLEVARELDIVFPSKDGNRDQRQSLFDLARLFRVAYRKRYRSRGCPAIRRIMRDVRDYLQTGTLPYYVMRTWLLQRQSESEIVQQMKLGQYVPLPTKVSPR
jgi:hypothetical protein